MHAALDFALSSSATSGYSPRPDRNVPHHARLRPAAPPGTGTTSRLPARASGSTAIPTLRFTGESHLRAPTPVLPGKSSGASMTPRMLAREVIAFPATTAFCLAWTVVFAAMTVIQIEQDGPPP